MALFSKTLNDRKEIESMRPNAQQLSLRDPAAAALLGIINGASFGADFGYGDFSPMGDEMGADFGDEWGADFGDATVASAPAPTAAQLVALHRRNVQRSVVSSKRAALLEPNKHSDVKVERYSFGLSQAIVIGTAVGITLSGNPSVDIRPQRICTNVPGPNFVFLTLIQVANVVVTVGNGVEDANDYAAHAVGTILDLPTLSTQTPARVSGNYFGFVPPAYVVGSASFFTCSFKGWANIVA
jgi:hypothetical protein